MVNRKVKSSHHFCQALTEFCSLVLCGNLGKIAPISINSSRRVFSVLTDNSLICCLRPGSVAVVWCALKPGKAHNLLRMDDFIVSPGQGRVYVENEEWYQAGLWEEAKINSVSHSHFKFIHWTRGWKLFFFGLSWQYMKKKIQNNE